MAERVEDVRNWLDSFDKDDQVYIDEGGLTLRSVKNPKAYYEIGGGPEGIEEFED